MSPSVEWSVPISLEASLAVLSEPEYCFQLRRPSLLTKVMLKHIRDAELGIGNFRLRTPRNEQVGAPKGPEDHASVQARSGALRAPTVRWGRGWKEAEELSKLRPH